MLRILTALTLLLSSALAATAADDWVPYANARFGYVLDIPPGFELQSQGDNGDGASFHANDNGATLSVFGSTLLDGDFETDVNDRIGYERGAAIVKQAYREGRAVIDVAREVTGLSQPELQDALDPLGLTRPSTPAPKEKPR